MKNKFKVSGMINSIEILWAQRNGTGEIQLDFEDENSNQYSVVIEMSSGIYNNAEMSSPDSFLVIEMYDHRGNLRNFPIDTDYEHLIYQCLEIDNNYTKFVDACRS
jgi:hypothetical protein